MKKNRPATMVSVLCDNGHKREILELLYRETSTLGVRVRQVEREILEREMVSVNTRFGAIDVKIGRFNGDIVNAMPEYEQVRSAAIAHNVTFSVVRDAAMDAIGTSAAAVAK
jgi:uncharacterized protein (DUF111 family)